MKKIEQIYHHYTKWEGSGMWQVFHGEKRKELLKKAIVFTKNTKLYGKYMMKVIEKWPYFCEQNLTCKNINRQAWIGHAACYLALQCPEDITREAWHSLTKTEQDDANLEADKAIGKWEKMYLEEMQSKSEQLSLF